MGDDNAGPGNGDGNETNGGNATGNETDDADIVNLEGEIGETPEYLEITSFKSYETSDDVGVFGTVKNVGDNPVDDLEVEVTLNDGDTVIGEFVDTTEKEIDYLRPGNQWRFNVVFEDENLSKATGFTVSAEGEIVDDSEFGNETGNTTGNGTGNTTGNETNGGNETA